MPPHNRRPSALAKLPDPGARGHGDPHRMIVIVGAGPAGMAAARRARECGAEVTVVDENPVPGGQIWRGERRALVEGVRFISSARVVSGDAASQTLTIETDEGARELSYDALILAT